VTFRRCPALYPYEGRGKQKNIGQFGHKKPGIVLKGERRWLCDYFFENRVCRECFYKDALTKKKVSEI
jgi:hypothetical protein